MFTTKITKDTKGRKFKIPNFVLFALRPKAYGRRVVSFVVKNVFGRSAATCRHSITSYGIGTLPNISSIISSGEIFSASARTVRIKRWRSASGAIRLTSAGST